MLRDTLTGSMKDAMKAKDQITLSTLRLVNAAIKQQDIDVRASGNEDGIADSEILSLLQKMIKQRRESIRMYEEGGRADAAAQEGGFAPGAIDEGPDHCGQSNRTVMPGRSPSTRDTGDRRTSKLFTSKPLDWRVARHVAKSPAGAM